MSSDSVAALMRAFGSKLPARLAALEAALTLARSGDAEGLGTARRLAHKLHGIAGSYGYAAVSVAAGDLEALLDEEPPNWEEVDSAGRALRDVVGAAAGGDS